jgi:O-antigen/teichoic acid export membrane protein
MIRPLFNSPVFWTGFVTLLRTGGFFLVLPLVLKKIPTEELGVWYVFLGIAQFSGIVELGFAPNISRFASYFMGGAPGPRSLGIDHATEEGNEPNLAALKGLAEMSMNLYPKIGATMGIIMTVGGGTWLHYKFGDAFWSWRVAPAFFLYAAGMTMNMYGYFWMNLLFGVDRVRQGQQIFALGLVLNYLLCVAGLLLGAGLYALALGQVALALVPRFMARRIVTSDFLSVTPALQKVSWRDLWPMTWRSGVGAFGSYLSLPVMTLVCAQVVGLADTASYGLSLQLAFMLHGLSATWMAVTWPRMGAMRVSGDYSKIRTLITKRLGLSLLTYLIGGFVAWSIAPGALHLFHSKTQFLGPVPLALLLTVVGVDCFLGLCNAILLTGNHVPHMKVTLLTGVAAVLVAFPLGHYCGIVGIIIAPLCAQALMNLWYTPLLCIKDLGFIKIKETC